MNTKAGAATEAGFAETMTVVYLTIPLMALATVVAVGPLLWAMKHQGEWGESSGFAEPAIVSAERSSAAGSMSGVAICFARPMALPQLDRRPRSSAGSAESFRPPRGAGVLSPAARVAGEDHSSAA
jgi:hypothetical protein